MLAATTALGVAPARAAGLFDACDERFTARPDAYESAYCYVQAAQRGRDWGQAAKRLDALMVREPANFWLAVARGHVELQQDPRRAEGFYRAAAEGFAGAGQAEGEVLARSSLRLLLYKSGRLEEAGQEVERAVRVAEASAQDLVVARALTLQATHLTDIGHDLGDAYRLLRRAEATGAHASYLLRRTIVLALGNNCFQRGRSEEALDYYRLADEMAAAANDLPARAAAQYSLVNTRMRHLEELPRPGGGDELLASARTALATAMEADSRDAQVLLHRTLGELLGGRAERAAEAEHQFGQCVAKARAGGQPRELAQCLWSLGLHLAERGRAREARRCVEQSLGLARRLGHAWSLAHASRQRMRVSWRTRPRDEAIAESEEALAAMESLRRLQGDESAAQVFSPWTRDYYYLIGRLLDRGPERADRGDIEHAFALGERMRGRVLLESLAAGRTERQPGVRNPAVDSHEQLLRRVAETHTELLDPGLGSEGRRAVLRRLERLELEVEESRGRLHAWQPRAPAYAAPRLATLSEVEAGLQPNEALLSFVIGLWEELMGDFGGGAWLSVSTRQGTKTYRMPDRVRLQAVVPVFVGLFERRDGREAAAAAVLYDELLRSAMAELPASIDRLVVIPDDALHHVPLAALRAAADREPLLARYELAYAPSATLWLRWRQAPRPPVLRPALILADPPAALLRALPHARREGTAIRRRLGGGSELWVGPTASEHRLKTARLGDFGVVHFAAHAVADEERPQRSAVFLAPGGPSEDGFLQASEIAELPLEGRVVVLSACRSARGTVLRGEGVFGLGRAFFEAGAHGVVGSLWPLRDDEAAVLFEAFYRRLGDGASVGAALRSAQLEALRAGRPAAAWAGLVVMGDGALQPIARRPGRDPWRLWLLAGASAAALSVLLPLLYRRARPARQRSTQMP